MQARPPQSSPCLRLSAEVQSWASLAGVAEPTRAQLRKLGPAIGDFAGDGLAGVAPDDEWHALDLQLSRILEGKEPGPGPRFRRDLPTEIRAAAVKVDDAVRDSKLERACSAIDEVTIALSQWRWSVPAPRGLQLVKDATERLDAMPADCRASTLGSVASRWGQAMALLAP